MTQETGIWTRPGSVPIPTVWRRFEGLLELSDGKKPRFVIQDLTEDRLEEVIDLMATVFCRDECMLQTLNILEDPVSVKELAQFYRDIFRDGVAVVALLDDGSTKPRIAGANMLYICRIQDKYDVDTFKGPAMWRAAKDCCKNAAKYVNVFEHFDVKEYLAAFGLVVHPDFRGQGLGAEILKARESLCKAVGLKATMTIFSSFGGQKSAQRAGMDLLAEIPYSVFRNKDGKEAYPGIEPKSMKVMGKKFPTNSV